MNPNPSERDDADLVSATLAGEDRAFTELMRRHKEPIYRFVRHYVGDADEAYDLVQETFLAAWTALSSFDARRSMPAWMRRIALNKCRDWSRRRQVRRFFFKADHLDSVAARTIAVDDSRHDDTRDRTMANLDAAIAALPSTLKEPLILTVFEGLSQQEAALALGVSVKAVETRLYRARQMLTAVLGQTKDVDKRS